MPVDVTIEYRPVHVTGKDTGCCSVKVAATGRSSVRDGVEEPSTGRPI